MTSLRCFETPIVIDSKNYKNDEIQKKLEIIHSTKDLTNRYELWTEEEKRHKTNIRSIQKEKREWYKLHRITAGLNSGYVGNLFPDYLLKLYAPLFFKNYPD